MEKLSRADVYPPRLYEPIRDELRRKVMEQKRVRRVHLGPVLTLVFENRATMIFQVSEMLRAERIEADDKIQAEVDVYNSLLPDEGQLAATLFVEITEEKEIKPTLRRMVGIDAHVALFVDGARVPAEFEAGRSEEERIASVQYLRFRLDDNARAALQRPGTQLFLESDLPGYLHRVQLDEATRSSLAQDLR